MTVEVKDAQGQFLRNAPLHFAVSSGAATLSPQANGTFSSAIDTRSDALGHAAAYVRLPANVSDSNVSIQAVSGANSVTVNAAEHAITVTRMPAVAAGDFHTVALGSNGMVWTWGLNSSGQLGDGTFLQRTLPTQVAGLRNVVAISAGEYHTLALTSDGQVFAWGHNQFGQLGTADYFNHASFGPVFKADGSELSNVVAISAGSYHSLALTTDGKVYAWGLNSFGQLGTGDTINRNRATLIPCVGGVTSIAAGGYHSVVLSSSGTIQGWGTNFFGALADVNIETASPTTIFASVTNVARVISGGYHTMFVRNDGSIVAAGWNGYGQLGDGSTHNRATADVIANLTNVQSLDGSLLLAAHCGAVLSSNVLETWGGNAFGEIGNGTTSDALSPQNIALPQVVALATGGYHTVAVAMDGSIYDWGYNGLGQLGNGTTTDQALPTRKTGFSLLPRIDDSDGDNLPDSWEPQYFGNLAQSGDGDPDGDHLANLQEFQQAHDPTAADNPVVNPDSIATQFFNVSGRALVTGSNVITSTFVIQGDTPKRVAVRAMGPSLQQYNVTGYLPNPQLQLFDNAGAILASNDDWQTTQIGGLITGDQVSDIQAANLAPQFASEAAMIVTLSPGSYTAVIKSSDGQTGVGLFETYDLDPNSGEILGVSARAQIQTGDNVLIGGVIIGGGAINVLARGLGPSLANSGIQDVLLDPVLELHDQQSGAVLASNDNWRDTQQNAILATGLPPSDNRESAILRQLPPGNFTATLHGKNGAVGAGVVEFYNVDSPTPIQPFPTPSIPPTPTPTPTPNPTPTPDPNPPPTPNPTPTPTPTPTPVSVTYNAAAPDCGGPTVTVQTLTNPYPGACLVSADFSVDDDILIDGAVYQSPGTNFTFHDSSDNACPDENGTHNDHYERIMSAGEQITFGVRSNFVGQISLSATVSFIPVQIVPDDNVVGRLGDMVGSNQGASGEKHFVSPPNLQDNPNYTAIDDYVTFKVLGVTSDQFSRLLQWDTSAGEDVPNEPTKRRVKRLQAGQNVLKLLSKQSGPEVARLNV